MTARNALRVATAQLTAVTDTPRLDAELLMAHAMDVERDALILHHLDDPQPDAFAAFIARRLAHEPLAYITGLREFWTISLHVTPDVLIPRPDSETLIEAAIDHFVDRTPARILDLGTGSGALLLAALSHWPDAHGLGVDASQRAVDVAERNARTLGLDGRARFMVGDWAFHLNGQFDLILCNPPYVETTAILTPEVLAEPHSALFAGRDGLDDYRRIVPQLSDLIAPHGCAVLEIGHTQSAAVAHLLAQEGLRPAVRQDLGQRDRAVIATG
jgi:release factor glutamine methyltransferase